MRSAVSARSLSTKVLVGASFLVATAVSQALAQSATDSNALQEVVVTAQFRQQNLQQTPIAITAVNAAMLEARNQTDIAQVAAQAPNVTLTQNGAAFGSSMVAFIRGVGQTDFNLALEPGVGIYVDDVYHATLTGSVLDLLDLDRVEVLRGPQGTLAGKNSIGGSVKLFSKKPKGDGSGYVELTGGSYSRMDARGAADLALTDTLFMRASFASKHHDGYVTRLDYDCANGGKTNVPTLYSGNGCELGKEGSQAFNAGRLAFRWLASDNVEVNLTGNVTNDQSSVQANSLIKVNPALGSFAYIKGKDGNPVYYGSQFLTGDPFTTYAAFRSAVGSKFQPVPGVFPFGDDPYAPIIVPPINHFDSYGVSADVKWSLSDKTNLTFITAYSDYANQFAENTDESPIGVQVLLQKNFHHQFTAEARLNSQLGSLDYTFGGFYLKQNGGLNARVGLPWVGLDFIHGPDSTPATTKAVFLNGDYHLTDALTVDAGVRYTEEVKDYTYLRRNPDLTVPLATSKYNSAVAGLNNTEAHFQGTRTDYRLAMNYQFTPDTMAYLQTATGYKGGGVNPRPFYPSQTLSFKPETLTAYEAGFKTYMFSRTLRFNAAAFYNNYNDIQLTLNACPTPPLNGVQYPANPCALPSNVGSAHVKGLEVEFELHPADGLEIDGSASVMDFQYTKINNINNVGIQLDMITPYTPKRKASLGVQYELLSNAKGTLTPRVDVAYQSEYFTAPINDPMYNQIDARSTANARLTWKDTNNVWSAALIINNLTDKMYYTTLFDNHTSVGYVSGQPAMPRNYALTFKRNF
jgi:iron complex outermembrane recepter protein